MRNFISYSEYLARHPDAKSGAVTPVFLPAAPHAQTEPTAAAGVTAVNTAPALDSGFAQYAHFARPPSVEIAISPDAMRMRSADAGYPNAAEGYAPLIELGGRRKTARPAIDKGGKGGKGGAFALVIMLLCFLIAVSCALMLSRGLGLGHLKGSVTRYAAASHTAYCVQMAAPGTPEEAAQIARETRQKGGGGYIYLTDGLYLVLASAYDTEAACDDVIDTLMFSKVSASKFLIEIPAVSLDFTADKAAVAVIQRAYESFWSTYLALYNLSVDLDEGHIAADPARMKLGEKNKEISDLIKELGAAGASCTDMSYIHIKAALTALSGQLDTLFVDMDHAAQLSSDLKYAYLKLLHDFRALAMELS